MKNDKIKGFLFALLSGTVYGIIPLILLSVSRSGAVSGVLCSLFRQIFGSLILLPVMIKHIRKLRMNKKQLLLMFSLGLYSGFTTLTLYLAFDRLPSGVAIMIHYLYPLFALLLNVLVLKRKPPRGAVVAVALAFGGVVLLCDLALMPEKPLLGMILAAISGFFCGSWMMMEDKFCLGKTDMVVHSCTNLLGSATVLLLYNLIMGKLTFSFTAGQWGCLILAGACNILALTCLTQGIRFAGSVIASVLSTFEPIVCTLGSALVLGDPISPRILLGSALVLGAVVLLTLKSADKSAEKGAPKDTENR